MELKPDLGDFYDIRPGNGLSLFYNYRGHTGEQGVLLKGPRLIFTSVLSYMQEKR